MLENIKIMLGDSANNYTDAQIALCLNYALSEIESYCNRPIDRELEPIAEQIAIIKLNRLGTEGLSSENFSNISQNYIDGYPAHIKSILNRKRKIQIL